MQKNLKTMKKEINAAIGKIPADLVIKNAKITDIFNGEFISGDIAIVGEKIVGIGEEYDGTKIIDAKGKVAVPGFIDPHIHIESSYLTPQEFIKTCIKHGTTSAFVDPHEIANVNGVEGIEYIEKFTSLPFDLQIWVPSCVPASKWEDSFENIDAEKIKKNFYTNAKKNHIAGLAEFMDYEAVINGDDYALEKIRDAHNHKRIIDGHLPNLNGYKTNAYLSQGIRCDHESISPEECKVKLSKGCHILLRYGDMSKELLENIKVVNEFNKNHISLCGDDINAHCLWNEGHINRAYKVAKNYVGNFWALRMGTINTARLMNKHYQGAIAPGYRADIVLIDNLDDYNISDTICKGIHVYSNGKLLFKDIIVKEPKQIFNHKIFSAKDFKINYQNKKAIPVIKPKGFRSELTTLNLPHHNYLNINNNISKVSIIDRYNNYKNLDNFTCLALDTGFKFGAIAQTINHDSHNVIVAGRNEEDMAIAVNELKNMGGGVIAIKNKKIIAKFELPIAGLMSRKSVQEVSEEWNSFESKIQPLLFEGADNPILTMRALGLTVIPEGRISLHGIIDVVNDEICLKNN